MPFLFRFSDNIYFDMQSENSFFSSRPPKSGLPPPPSPNSGGKFNNLETESTKSNSPTAPPEMDEHRISFLPTSLLLHRRSPSCPTLQHHSLVGRRMREEETEDQESRSPAVLLSLCKPIIRSSNQSSPEEGGGGGRCCSRRRIPSPLR